MKHRRGQRGVGLAGREDLVEVLERPGAARGDHGNRHGGRHGGGQRAVEPAAGAVAIDGRQEDLSRAAVRRLARPLDRLAAGRRSVRCARTPRSDRPVALRVDGDDHRLRAIPRRQPRQERRVLERGAVRARPCRRRRRAPPPRPPRDRMPPPTASGMKSSAETARSVSSSARRFSMRRGDVEDDQLVDALGVVAPRERGRLAGVRESFELHALDDAAVADVEAGDQALGTHDHLEIWKFGNLEIFTKERRMRRPASPDFSGWNCTPKTPSVLDGRREPDAVLRRRHGRPRDRRRRRNA